MILKKAYPIFMLFVVLAAVSCDKKETLEHTLEGEWYLTRIEGTTTSKPEGRETISLEFNAGKLTGSTETNQFSGSYEVSAKTLIIGTLISTFVNESAFGSDFFDAIATKGNTTKANFTINIEGNILSLTNLGDQKLVLVRAQGYIPLE